MELGIFTKTYKSNDIDYVFQQMRNTGLFNAQINMNLIAEKTIPANIDYKSLDYLKEKAKFYNINLTGISGTYNILSDKESFNNFENLTIIADYLKINLITICTGSYSKNSMWEYVEENLSEDAYLKCKEEILKLIEITKKYNIKIGIEPESGNVINNARRAHRLLKEVNSEYLGIVLDVANLLPRTDLNRQHETIDEAFELLNNHIVCVHGKDYIENGDFVAAGSGVVDYKYFIKKLKEINYEGIMYLHQLLPEQVYSSVNFMNGLQL